MDSRSERGGFKDDVDDEDDNYPNDLLSSSSERGTSGTGGMGGESDIYASMLAKNDNDIDDDNYNDNELENDNDYKKLQAGDHVYVLQGFSSQRHGIIVEVPKSTSTNILSDENIFGVHPGDDNHDEYDDIIIAVFYEQSIKRNEEGRKSFFRGIGRRDRNANNTSGMVAKNEDLSEVRTSLTNENRIVDKQREVIKISLRQFAKGGKRVHKVRYNATRATRLLSRGGTATCIQPDVSGLIMARVEHLFAHTESLPDYKRLAANDECVAVWCRTGRWVTLQGASMLELISAAQASSAVAAGTVASSMTVTYSMQWMQGMVLVWTVPATVAYPLLVPLLVGYGLTSLVPLEVLRRHRKNWKELTDSMNRAFWALASDDTKQDYFKGSLNANDGVIEKFFGITASNKENNSNGGEGFKDDYDNSEYLPVNADGGNDGEIVDQYDDGNDLSSIQRDANRYAAATNFHQGPNDRKSRAQQLVGIGRGILGTGKNVWCSTSNLVRRKNNDWRGQSNNGSNGTSGRSTYSDNAEERGGLMSHQSI